MPGRVKPHRISVSRVRARGFTLLELLIVIVILSILASLLLWGVTAAIRASKSSLSAGVVRSITEALESYKSQFGDYPPSSLDRLKVKLPNDTNNGIEALVACLETKKGGGPFYHAPDEGLWVNRDRDKVKKIPTDWIFGDTQLFELQDGFGNVLWYIHHSDYEKPEKYHLRVVSEEGGKKLKVKVYRNETTKTFCNPGRFQLVSPGADGVFGTDDDIRGW